MLADSYEENSKLLDDDESLWEILVIENLNIIKLLKGNWMGREFKKEKHYEKKNEILKKWAGESIISKKIFIGHFFLVFYSFKEKKLQF